MTTTKIVIMMMHLVAIVKSTFRVIVAVIMMVTMLHWLITDKLTVSVKMIRTILRLVKQVMKVIARAKIAVLLVVLIVISRITSLCRRNRYH